MAELRDGRDVLVQWSKIRIVATMIGKFNDRVKIRGPVCATLLESVVTTISLLSYGINLQGNHATSSRVVVALNVETDGIPIH